MGQEMAEVNRNLGKHSERTKKELLPDGLIRVKGLTLG